LCWSQYGKSTFLRRWLLSWQHLGGDPLTDRELEVLRLVMVGNCNRAIGDSLSISEETVKAHLKHISEKLGAADRTQAVTIALRRGLIQT